MLKLTHEQLPIFNITLQLKIISFSLRTPFLSSFFPRINKKDHTFTYIRFRLIYKSTPLTFFHIKSKLHRVSTPEKNIKNTQRFLRKSFEKWDTNRPWIIHLRRKLLCKIRLVLGNARNYAFSENACGQSWYLRCWKVDSSRKNYALLLSVLENWVMAI